MRAAEEAALEEKIAKLETQLRKLKLRLRSLRATRSSAAARTHAARDAEIVAAYAEADGRYGTVKQLALEWNLSTKQIHRILSRERKAHASAFGAP